VIEQRRIFPGARLGSARSRLTARGDGTSANRLPKLRAHRRVRIGSHIVVATLFSELG
jgi:hypothetical protein